MNVSNTASMQVIRCIVCAIFAVLCEMAQGADPVATSPLASQQGIGETVIQQLRDGDIERALKSLEAVADRTSQLEPVDEGLSQACGCLHRALSQQSSEVQFDLLFKWSMPTASSPGIRVLTMLVPTTAPPAEFARALGERPRGTSFPIASIGEVRGIFSSAWMLIAAARDSGRLKRLTTDTARLVEKRVPNADLLMTLAQLADSKADASKFVEELATRAVQIKTAVPPSGSGPAMIAPANVVLACAALQHPTLHSVGEEMFAALVDRSSGNAAAKMRPFLRRAHATAVLLNRKDHSAVGVASKMMSRLKYWVPVCETLDGSTSPAISDPVWFVHEDHLLHLSGSGNDGLFFRYPLVGSFQFGCETETKVDGRFATDGGLIYGGRGYHVAGGNSEFRLSDPGDRVLQGRFCPYIRQPSAPGFNRLSITSGNRSPQPDSPQSGGARKPDRSTSDSVTLAVNLHPMWTDNVESQASPWLGLKSRGDCNPVFRNLKLTGQPVIPRSVRLSDGNVLRGWQSQSFGDRADVSRAENQWRLTEGVLAAPRYEPKTSSNKQEQVFSYQRPLLVGETISYEYFYEPGVRDVSPALGRVAFLLQPDGVRIHWVTDGQRDWTGLASDNAVTESLNRRGPRPLPFKARDWNHVTLARSETSVTMTLNNVVVYQRPVDWTGDHRFGFYRSSNGAGAQVRNVVLTGDWPESVPQEFLDYPTMGVGEPLDVADRHAMNRLFDEELLAGNVSAIRRRARSMPVADRLEFLSRWVLPGSDHPGFRMTGEFTQTQPAPVALEPAVTHSELGGQIVSPVFDWLDAARELGQLTECRRRVEAATVSDQEPQRRARAALLMLLSLEAGDATAVARDFENLLSLVQLQSPKGIADQWPETLVAVRGARKLESNPAVSELISFLYLQRALISRPNGINLWHTHITSLYGRMQFLKASKLDVDRHAQTGLKEWIPVTAAKSNSRGQGYPNLEWSRHDSTIIKRSGHLEDYFFYRQPLSGDFEVECDFLQPNQSTSLMMVGGESVGVESDFKQLLRAPFGSWIRLQPLDSPLTYFGHSVRYRCVVRDGACTVYLNGRPIQMEPQQVAFDPWIAIRSWGRHLNSVQDLRVTGRPKVLDAVPLSGSVAQHGWIEYHEESIVGDDGQWRHLDDPESKGWIVGRANPALAGTVAESLLRYQRPLVEDGSIEYEFFYQPGKIEVHPAFDRLALILQPQAVREHWITDGRYDRTDLAPDNLTHDPKCHRGPAELPLKPGEWNRVKLILRRATVNLELNGTLVYARELEAQNQRTFGLFHYADVTEARVRNVVMRGDWPKTLPPTSDQELAGRSTDAIDAGLSRLKSVFRHDFQKDGLPQKYFRVPPQAAGSSCKTTAEGLEVTSTGTGNWTYSEISPRFTLAGDFEIEAKFDQLRMEFSKRNGGVHLNVTFNEPLKPDFGLNRLLADSTMNFICPSRNIAKTGGERAWIAKDIACESMSGRFRLSRRANKVHYLFADGDSENFQLLDTQTAPELDTDRDGIRLYSLCQSVGTASAIWKNISLKAERMVWHPDPPVLPTDALYVMNPDGSGLRNLVTPAKAGFTNVGFAEWSSDGHKIAMEMSNGSKSTSHVVVTNADGTGLIDLGPGCMPSFSHDGTRLVCSVPRAGIVTLDGDGTNRQVIDAAGWGAQWSPDGKWIAYGKSGNIMLLDMKTHRARLLLTGDGATRYSYIYGNPCWSHDSRSIVFKARCRDIIQDELVVAELDSPGEFKVLLSDARAIGPDIAFSADNQQVIVSVELEEPSELKLQAINRMQPDQISSVLGQPPGHRVTGCAWSQDGKSILFASNSITGVEWIEGPISGPTIE